MGWLIITVFLISGCGKSDWEWVTPGGKVMKVSTVSCESKGQTKAVVVFAVGKKNLSSVISAQGAIEAGNKAALSSEISAEVKKVNVSAGDKVKKGDLLCRLEGSKIKRKLNNTSSRLKRLKEQYNRIKSLYDDGGATVTQREKAEADFSAVKAELEGVKEQYKMTKIYAPFTGTVAGVYFSESELFTAGRTIIEMINLDDVIIRVGVSEMDIGKVKKGQTAEIKVETYPDEKFQGKVNYVSEKTDSMSRKFPVEVLIANVGQKLKEGMTARMKIVTGIIENALVIPCDAVINTEQEQYVFTAVNGRARKKQVAAGLNDGEFIEIKEGLSEGDSVIVKGQFFMTEGARVKIVPADSGR